MLPADVPPNPMNSILASSAARRHPANAAPLTPPPSITAYACIAPRFQSKCSHDSLQNWVKDLLIAFNPRTVGCKTQSQKLTPNRLPIGCPEGTFICFAESLQGRGNTKRPRSPESLESQVIVHRDLDILFRAQIAFRGLDGGVPQQEFDLLQITAVLAAELGAGTAEVVSAEALDADLLR
jgi:hypothetical protein